MINNSTKQNKEDLLQLKDGLGIEMKLVEQNFTNKINDVKLIFESNETTLDERISVSIHR